jgi:hypothetical protein
MQSRPAGPNPPGGSLSSLLEWAKIKRSGYLPVFFFAAFLAAFLAAFFLATTRPPSKGPWRDPSPLPTALHSKPCRPLATPPTVSESHP